MHGRIIAFKNPYDPSQVIFRRVIASELLWVKRKDDNGLIQIPRGHLWVESDTINGVNIDSLTMLGPISTGLALGEAIAVVWPPQKIQWIASLEKLR